MIKEPQYLIISRIGGRRWVSYKTDDEKDVLNSLDEISKKDKYKNIKHAVYELMM